MIAAALGCIGLICLYPLTYVFSMSISNPMRIARETLWLLPKGFSLPAYKKVFENPQIWRCYYNTLWYTIVGTSLNVVLTIFYAVFHWNSFFPALIYLPDSKLHPLQLFLMKLLIQNDTARMEEGIEEALDKLFVAQQLKYAAIMVTVLPIILIYPFMQKHFVKGVMIGAIKG